MAECIRVIAKKNYSIYNVYVHDILNKELDLIVVRKVDEIFYENHEYDDCIVVGSKINVLNKLGNKYLEYHFKLRI